jgi:hypothetical protein
LHPCNFYHCHFLKMVSPSVLPLTRSFIRKRNDEKSLHLCFNERAEFAKRHAKKFCSVVNDRKRRNFFAVFDFGNVNLVRIYCVGKFFL